LNCRSSCDPTERRNKIWWQIRTWCCWIFHCF
jgi:hypothetical protein